ncbi:hypothetical protein [Streptomyces hygroscopicus]|uniref:hypothetical protein n=1 Tax=Streptomyces hygroscopicus TaxID=1912 RepID=UPI0007DB62B2|nr:hypothetical protein [Streptomyces sp. NBRC 109436]
MVVDARRAPSGLGDAPDRLGERRDPPPRVPYDGQALVLARHLAVHTRTSARAISRWNTAVSRAVHARERPREPLEHGLAARRYAISGDRRALHGTIL